MTSHGQDEPILRLLSRLPAARPDPTRADRLRQRLQDMVRRRLNQADRRALAKRRLKPIVVGVFSLAYLAVLLHDLLHWHGVL